MAIQVKAMNFLRNMCEGTAVEVSIVMDWVEVGTPFTVLGVVAEALHASSPSAVLQHALYVASNLTACALLLTPIGALYIMYLTIGPVSYSALPVDLLAPSWYPTIVASQRALLISQSSWFDECENEVTDMAPAVKVCWTSTVR